MSARDVFRIPDSLREEVRVVSAAYGALIVIGYALTLLYPASTRSLLDLYFSAAAAGSGEAVATVTRGELFSVILLSNLFEASVAVFLGFLPLLRLPVFSLGLNAVLFGAFAAYYQSSGFPLGAYLVGTLPHGVFEIAALSVSCACGLYLCRTVSDRVRGRETELTIGQVWRLCSRVYLCVTAPLLLVGALVESFLSPVLLSLAMG